MIKGGYVILTRSLEWLSGRPPIERELYLYLLRNVNYKDTDLCKRGTGLFQLTQIAEDLSWSIGARKEKYKIPALSKALRRLNESSVTATTRSTRGIFITVCNYDYYQDPNNYEGNDERTPKATRRQSDTIRKKESKEDTTVVVSVESNNDSVITVDTKTQAHDDWRKDFQVYLNITRQAYLYIVNTPDVFATQQRLNPGLDVQKSLEKACINFWATEAGWQHKKKSRSKNIDMIRTLITAISHQSNKVYEQRNGTSRNGDSSAARGISDAYKLKILRTMGVVGGDGTLS